MVSDRLAHLTASVSLQLAAGTHRLAFTSKLLKGMCLLFPFDPSHYCKNYTIPAIMFECPSFKDTLIVGTSETHTSLDLITW